MEILERMQKKLGYTLSEATGVNYKGQLGEIKIISTQQAFELMWNTNGQIFTAVFIKKDGSERTLTARRHVKKYLKGGELGYKPSELQLIPCFEMIGGKQGGYKMVNAKTTEVIQYQGVTYSVDHTL